jgi:putative heme-binding domain-containing protein
MRAAVLSSAVSDAVSVFSHLAADPSFSGPSARSFMTQLTGQICLQDREDDLRHMVQACTGIADRSPLMFAAVADALQRHRRREGSSIAKLAAAGELESIDSAIDALSAPLTEIAEDPDADLPKRLAAIKGLASGDWSTAQLPLASLLEAQQPVSASDRNRILEQYADTLSLAGDAERGAALFKTHCASCHRAGDAGHELGPNLTSIKTRGPQNILSNVLDPNGEVNPQYLGYAVVTADGRLLSGVIADEGATSITLRSGDNVSQTLLRIEIDEIKSTGRSIMPEGFERVLDRQAMADLIAFLMQVE